MANICGKPPSLNFFKLVEPTLKQQTKHHRPPDHRPPLKPPLSYSLTLLLQLFLLKLKSRKICFVLSALCPFKPTMAAFPQTIAMIGWALSSWPIIKSHTDNTWLYWNKKEKRQHQLLKNVTHSHFLQTDRHASLPFMRLINFAA